MNSKACVFQFLLCLVPSLASGSEERIVEPVEVTIRADMELPFGKVVATIRKAHRESERRIAEIALHVNGKFVPVPVEAYRDLESPLLRTLQFRTEAGYDKDPWLYLFFEVGHGTLVGPKFVRIAYHAGRIESRSIQKRTADGKFELAVKDLPANPRTASKDTVTRVLKIKVAGKVEAVFWVTQNDLCTIQFGFPLVRDDEQQPEHAGTAVWLLKADGSAIAPARKTGRVGVSKSGYVTESDVYTFPASARTDAVAVVVSIDDELFTERL